MIQNPLILEKLKEKTLGDEAMHEFILSIMTNESNGKQYAKFFRAEVEKYSKLREEKGGADK